MPMTYICHVYSRHASKSDRQYMDSLHGLSYTDHRSSNHTDTANVYMPSGFRIISAG